MRWRRWLGISKQARAVGVDPRAARRDPPSAADLRIELERRGVPEDFSLALAERAAQHAAAQDPATVRPMLDGMALAFEVERSSREQLKRSLRGLREVERMMGAFSGELSKLDEVLGVLAAYVRRMRSTGAVESDRTLH